MMKAILLFKNIFENGGDFMKTHRILALFLAIVLCIGSVLPISAFAVESTQRNTSLNEVLNTLQQAHPNATITVEDGTIHVVMPKQDPGNSSRASEIAPQGGSWKNFSPPYEYLVNPSLVRPYCIVFLPENLTTALVISMAEDYVWGYIQDCLDIGDPIEIIVTKLLANYGLALSYAQVFFLAYSVSSEVYDLLNIYSINNAVSNSDDNKVSIQFCEADGWPVNYYYAWEGNTVYDSPWEAFNADFYAGDYSGMDQ